MTGSEFRLIFALAIRRKEQQALPSLFIKTEEKLIGALDINIDENEFSSLLDRTKATSDASRAFKKQLQLLRDIVNYGTNLIPRSFSSSAKELKDLVVIPILLRQVVAMLDAIEVLLSAGIVYSAGLQARALFEASAYVEWILQSDAAKKATFYYVHDVRKQRLWALRLQPQSPEAEQFAEIAPDLQSLRDADAIAAARQSLMEIDENLSQPRFADANAAFDTLKQKNFDVAWYAPLGVRTFRALVGVLGRTDEYEVFYAWWSGAMHSSGYRQHVRIEEGKVTFNPLRILSDFEVLFRFSAAVTLRTYRKILETYRSGELQTFNRKYLEKWRGAFMNVPKIKYEVVQTGPAS